MNTKTMWGTHDCLIKASKTEGGKKKLPLGGERGKGVTGRGKRDRKRLEIDLQTAGGGEVKTPGSLGKQGRKLKGKKRKEGDKEIGEEVEVGEGRRKKEKEEKRKKKRVGRGMERSNEEGWWGVHTAKKSNGLSWGKMGGGWFVKVRGQNQKDGVTFKKSGGMKGEASITEGYCCQQEEEPRAEGKLDRDLQGDIMSRRRDVTAPDCH